MHKKNTCRMLEQLRKQQGSVLHPNYSAPFHSFEDTLHRLLPYHLYQGTANSSEDYQRGRKTQQPFAQHNSACPVFMSLHGLFNPLFCAQWTMSLNGSPATC